MFDEELPRPKSGFQPGQKLDDLSVSELHEAVEMLKLEIARIEQAIGTKSSHLDAAQALFSRK